MNMYRFPARCCVLCCFVLSFSALRAQFFLNGSAKVVNDTCYELTTATNWQVGSIWNPDKIDLRNSFDLVMKINLGCSDAGADGIVFGLQPVSTSIGQSGEGIGFQGVRPSLGVEIDTWQNSNLSDPTFDHIAIISNGVMDHGQPNGRLAGPQQASQVSLNIEDCKFHDLRVSWDAAAKKMEVFFDCKPVLSYTGDIVNTIFGGDPLVFWGFTAATGGANNTHTVCFSYTTFLDRIPDYVLCPGGQIQLKGTGGVRYEWTPAEGLSDPFSPRPIAAPTQTTDYVVKVFDACDIPFYDSVRVAVAGDSVFFDLGVDTTLCRGQVLVLDATTPTAIYQWSGGTTAPTL